MKEKKILVVSSSTKMWKNETLIGRSLCNFKNVEFQFIGLNEKSLAYNYNQFLIDDYKDYIITFVHDDVFISDKDFPDKCREAIESYDVFGVAGGDGPLRIDSSKPALWHLISDRRVGSAGHFDQTEINITDPFQTKHWITNFGKSPSKANLIDGVFIGVNVEKVIESNIKFDEECPAKFHFYDLLFSLNCKLKNVSLGVIPLELYHASHGLTNISEDFLEGEKYFKEFCRGISIDN